MAAEPRELWCGRARHDRRGFNDRVLVEQAVEADQDAIAEICRRYRPRVYGLALKLGRPEDAEDVAQEVMVRACSKLSGLRAAADLWQWLAMITRNVVIDEARRAQRESPADSGTVNHLVDARTTARAAGEEAVAQDEIEALRRELIGAFRTLPPRERTFVWRRLVDGCSVGEIATEYASTEHGVRNAVWRARKVLAARLHPARDRWNAPLVLAILPLLRRLREGTRSINQRLNRLSTAMVAGGETGASAITSLAVLLVAVASVPSVGGAARSAAARTVVQSTAAPVPVGPHVVGEQPQAPGPKQPTPNPYNPAEIMTQSGATKPKHIAPESSRLTVRVTTLDGKPVYSYETDYTCDENGSELLPDDSPINAVC